MRFLIVLLLPLFLGASILHRDSDKDTPFFQAVKIACNLSVPREVRDQQVKDFWRKTLPDEDNDEIHRLTTIVMFETDEGLDKDKAFIKRYGENASLALEEFIIYSRNKEYILGTYSERKALKEAALETLDEVIGQGKGYKP